MWNRLKGFGSGFLQDLVQVFKSVGSLIASNKMKLFMLTVVFGSASALFVYMVLNKPADKEFGDIESVVIVLLMIFKVLFLPVLIYALLPKSSFNLLSNDDNSGVIARFLNKFSLYHMLRRSYKTMLIVLGTVMFWFFSKSVLQAFVPSLFGVGDPESLIWSNLILVAPFALFFGYVLVAGGAISIIRSLTTDDSLKQVIVYSIKKSLKKFWVVVFLLVLYFAIEIGATILFSGFIYALEYFNCVMYALGVLVVYALSYDREGMKL
ncbi:hypothetical protein SOX05_08945 [Pseudomonas putida]|nr:hypothetical protein [Pseudomonas putida]MDY4319389.1 hypothetical protein [Pseudomonas putida]MDY4352774.1 hypothetical protein [Pseudomonas putida]